MCSEEKWAAGLRELFHANVLPVDTSVASSCQVALVIVLVSSGGDRSSTCSCGSGGCGGSSAVAATLVAVLRLVAEACGGVPAVGGTSTRFTSRLTSPSCNRRLATRVVSACLPPSPAPPCHEKRIHDVTFSSNVKTQPCVKRRLEHRRQVACPYQRGQQWRQC